MKDNILSNTTADKDTNGVLQKFIPQISNNLQSWDSSKKTFDMILKGPLTGLSSLLPKLRDYKSNANAAHDVNQFISSTSSLIDWDSSKLNNTSIWSTVVNAIPNTTWIVDSWSVEQSDAGAHVTVKITWKITSTSGSSAEDDEPLEEYWTCTLQPMIQSVLGYCKDDDGGDATGSDNTARSWRIKQWASVDNNDNEYKLSFRFNSGVGSTEVCQLNEIETKIAKFYVADINPQIHCPIIQHNREYDGKVVKANFASIDHITDLPNECPWKDTIGQWKFLKTGYNITYNNIRNTTTITEEWTGAEQWSEEFYGDAPKRWQWRSM